MKRTLSAMILLATALIGCASAPKAPRNAQGEKIAVQVYIDGGWDQVDATNPNEVSQRNQLVTYMKKTTVEQLNASGYSAVSIDSAKSYDPNSGARLLKISVDSYSAGSAAARLLVGMGAGAAKLDSRASYSEKGQDLCAVSNSIASSQDWRKIVKKTNILIMREMAKH